MVRPEIYTGEIPRTFDLLWGWRALATAVGNAAADSFGESGMLHFGTSPLAQITSDNAGVTATSSALTALVNGFDLGSATLFVQTIAPGRVYVFNTPDSVGANVQNNSGTQTAYADLAYGTNPVVLQCEMPVAGSIAVTPSYGGGTSFWYCIYVIANQLDTVDASDPNYSAPGAAILPFYNSANPQMPLAGPAGANPPTTSTTERIAGVTLGVATGSNSSTTVVPSLTLPTGAIPLYVGYTVSGNTTFVAAQRWAVGLGTGGSALTGSLSSYTAPFIRGLTQQHHLGVKGSAPKIDGGAEWLPLSTVPNNSQSISGLLPSAVAASAFGDADYATANSQFYLQPSGAPHSYSSWGTISTAVSSGGGSIGTTSLSNGLFCCIHPVTGGLWVISITGTINFTITDTVNAGSYLSTSGNTLPAAVTGVGLNGMINLTASINQIVADAGPAYSIITASAVADTGNPRTEFDLLFALGQTFPAATYAFNFSVQILAY